MFFMLIQAEKIDDLFNMSGLLYITYYKERLKRECSDSLWISYSDHFWQNI